VILHASAAVRNAAGEYPEWGNRMRSPEIDHFTGVYDPTSNSNPYAQAYILLKAKLAADSLASSIADA
jgi:protease II